VGENSKQYQVKTELLNIQIKINKLQMNHNTQLHFVICLLFGICGLKIVYFCACFL